ncbi:hypothetical protein BC835DRAFT_1309475 [Cytidiella melzeri]|nr:hypothetical protein BC835DRAFT_1309475 [Cytidiella melzeri]
MFSSPASKPSQPQIVLPSTTSPFQLSDGDFGYDIVDDYASPAPPSNASWETVAADARDGIHYVREHFPKDIPFLPTPFRQEPLTVEPDDKVVILSEVSEFAIRVRLLRTNQVGIIPAWNVEEPLEKLARRNMELNEIATSPSEEPNLRLRRYSTDEDDEDADGEFPLTPPSNTAATFLSGYRAMPSSSSTSAPPRPKPRKVGFTSPPKKTIFRYFTPHDPDSLDPCEEESGGESDQEPFSADAEAEGGEDYQWWWNGWEESHEGADSDHDDSTSNNQHRHRDEDKEVEDTGTKSLRLRIRMPHAFVVA